MNRWKLLWLPLLTICFLGFMPSAFSQSTTGVAGTVTDATTNRPLVGANIIVTRMDKGAITDEKGRFEIKYLAPGKYTIKVSYIGYSSTSKEVNLHAGRVHNYDFQLELEIQVVPEVEITAGKKQRTDFSVPMRINLIPSEVIKNDPGQNVTTVLDKISGVNSSTTMGIFSNSTVVSMRGLSGNDQGRTLILFDGIPMNKSDQGSVNWNLVNTENVERIEVIKGPGPAQYGSNAMGGVINVITHRPTRTFAGSATLNYATFNTLGFRYFLSGTTGKADKASGFYYNLNGFYRRSDGYNPEIPEYLEEADTFYVNNYVREANIGTKLGYAFNRRHRVELDVDFFNDKRGRGTQIYEVDGSYEQHGTYRVTGRYNGASGKTTWDAHLYTSNEHFQRLNEYMSDGSYNLYLVESNRIDQGGKATLDFPWGKKQKIVTGVDFTRGLVDGQDIYYTSTDLISNKGELLTLAGYVQDEIAFVPDKFLLSFGLRFNYAVFSNGSFSIEYPSYSIQYLVDYQDTLIPRHEWVELDPKLSVQYRFTPWNRLYFTIARGFRAPNLDDLCRTGKKSGGFKLANPALKPEVINSVEVGGDLRLHKKIQVSGSLYYSLGIDFMYYVSTGDSVNMGYKMDPVYQRQNISRVNIFGGEVDLDVQFLDNLDLFTNYSYCHSSIGQYDALIDGTEDLTGKFLTDVPMHKVNAGVSWKNNILNTALYWKFVGSRYINDMNETDPWLETAKYPSYNTFSIRLSKSFFNHLMVAVNCDNLFDVKYIDNRLMMSPGRIIMAEISVSF